MSYVFFDNEIFKVSEEMSFLLVDYSKINYFGFNGKFKFIIFISTSKRENFTRINSMSTKDLISDKSRFEGFDNKDIALERMYELLDMINK